jgi:hypothetical protein
VPVNDVAMTNVDQEAKELDQARARLDAAAQSSSSPSTSTPSASCPGGFTSCTRRSAS